MSTHASCKLKLASRTNCFLTSNIKGGTVESPLWKGTQKRHKILEHKTEKGTAKLSVWKIMAQQRNERAGKPSQQWQDRQKTTTAVYEITWKIREGWRSCSLEEKLCQTGNMSGQQRW